MGGTAVSVAALTTGSLRAETVRWKPVEQDPVSAPIAKDTTLKFNADGSPKPFAGNTLICHLPAQGRMRDATTVLGNALRSSSFASKLACLPPDSYHMTVFPGANDVDRAGYGWPADINVAVPIDECNRIIGERFKAFHLRTAMPIRMRVDGVRQLGSIRLAPVDSAENAKLRHLRDRLSSEVFHFLDQDHATYTFHISLAYRLAQLTTKEEAEHQVILGRYMPALMKEGSAFELGIPEYCTFHDMHRFEPQLILRS